MEYISREAALSAQNKSMNLAECRTRLERLPAADAIKKLSQECKVLYAMLGTHPDPKGELGDPGILREPPKEEA